MDDTEQKLQSLDDGNGRYRGRNHNMAANDGGEHANESVSLDDDGLISEAGSDFESILERSIRGNLKQLLSASIDSSIMSNSDQLQQNFFDRGSFGLAVNKLPLPK